MANDKQSFEELLNEAPLASKSDTVTLVGALSRTPEPHNFVLTLANGRSITLDTKAVKSHTRLGDAIGQVLVQLVLDAKLVPDDLRWPEAFANTPLALDKPILDKPPFLDHSLAWGSPSAPNPFGAAPFTMAAPHQAPARALAALQARHTGWGDPTGWADLPGTGWADRTGWAEW
jgi:hypothetical protein